MIVSAVTSYKSNMVTIDHDVIFLSSLLGIPNGVLTGRLDLEFTREEKMFRDENEDME